LVGQLNGTVARFKLEFMQPTGSYKDRGSAVLATALVRAGATAVAEDSSGNAGASLAAYLGSANIRMRLFAPKAAGAGAVRQARAYGSEVDQSATSRAEAARLAADVPAPFRPASHAVSAYFLAGVATMAFEVWEGLDRNAPESVVTPLGQGILTLGLYYGFVSLKEAGLITTIPRLYGVQAEGCSPFARAFSAGASDVAPSQSDATIARGVAVAEPVRGREVLGAIRSTGGGVVTVSDEQIAKTAGDLARMGWFVEPTGAVGAAGLEGISASGAGQNAVVPLTGNGLKVW
jgi:threonine synthase